MRRNRCRLKGENLLVVLTAAAVVFGIVLGVVLKETTNMTPRQISYFRFPGEVFLRMLRMLILPLIFASIVSSLATLETKTAGKLGMYTVAYYFTTTISAVVLGIILVVIIRPGRYGYEMPNGSKKHDCEGTIPADTLLDLIRNMFPSNIAGAMTMSQRTCYDIHLINNGSKKQITEDEANMLKINASENDLMSILYTPKTETKDGLNILGIVAFAIAFGVVLGANKDTCRVMLDFFVALETIIMKLIRFIIWLSPIGILFLIAAQIVGTPNLLGQLQNLALYLATVLSGLAIHGCIVLPLLLVLIGKRNPLKFLAGMVQALLTALGTSSSSASLPVTLECLEENNGINPKFGLPARDPRMSGREQRHQPKGLSLHGSIPSAYAHHCNFSSASLPVTLECLEENNGINPKVSRFMVPLGATINMDGTALYEAVAAIYIAQATEANLNFGHILIIRDRIRTTVNVWGDSLGTAIVERLCSKFLQQAESNKISDFGGHELKNFETNGSMKRGDPETPESEMTEMSENPRNGKGTTVINLTE